MNMDADLLRACYNALLNREPDDTAKTHWVTGEDPEVAVRNVLTAILDSPEFALKWGDSLRHKSGLKDVGFFNEQSQFGEIGRLVRQIVNSAAHGKIVVDVGANGRERSNSYDLLKYFGWKGLLIEANPGRSGIIEAEFFGLDYTLINCAVSDYAGEAMFHIGVNDDVSSLEIEATQGWGPVRGTIQVAVRPLHTILAEQQIPKDFDLLSIDAEGEDVRILNDAVANGYLPHWVIMEAVHEQSMPSLDPLGLTNAVLAAYEIVDSTVANLILRRIVPG